MMALGGTTMGLHGTYHDGIQPQRQTEKVQTERFSSRHEDNHSCPMYPPGGGLVGSVGLDRGEISCYCVCVRGVCAGVCRMCEL